MSYDSWTEKISQLNLLHLMTEKSTDYDSQNFLRLNVKCLSKCVEGWYSSRDSKPGKVVYTTNVTCNQDGIKALLLRQNFDWSSNWCGELWPPHCGAAVDEPQ